jgi:hypothetical protein
MHDPINLLIAALFLLPALIAVPATAGEAVPSFPPLNLTPFGDDRALNTTAAPLDLVRAEADTRGHGARGEMAAETTYLAVSTDDLLVLLLFAGIVAVCFSLLRRFGG